MVTIFLLFSSFFVITKVIPFLFKLFFTFATLVFEIVGFMFLFTIVGVLGIVIFLVIDFLVLRILTKIFLV